MERFWEYHAWGGKQKIGLTKKYLSKGNKNFQHYLSMDFEEVKKNVGSLKKMGFGHSRKFRVFPFHPIQTLRNGFIRHFFIYEAILANFTPKYLS